MHAYPRTTYARTRTPVGDGDVGMDFAETGDVSEDDYSKDSIYAVLYSLYRQVI